MSDKFWKYREYAHKRGSKALAFFFTVLALELVTFVVSPLIMKHTTYIFQFYFYLTLVILLGITLLLVNEVKEYDIANYKVHWLIKRLAKANDLVDESILLTRAMRDLVKKCKRSKDVGNSSEFEFLSKIIQLKVEILSTQGVNIENDYKYTPDGICSLVNAELKLAFFMATTTEKTKQSLVTIGYPDEISGTPINLNKTVAESLYQGKGK